MKRNSTVKKKSKNKVYNRDNDNPSVAQSCSVTEPNEENVQTSSKIVQTSYKMNEGKMPKKSHESDVCKKERTLQLQSNRGPGVRTFPCDYCSQVSCV